MMNMVRRIAALAILALVLASCAGGRPSINRRCPRAAGRGSPRCAGRRLAFSLGRWPSIQALIASSASGGSWIAPSRLMLMLWNAYRSYLRQLH